MNIEIIEITSDDLQSNEQQFSALAKWSELWWADFDEAGIERCYIAVNGDDEIVGFQTVNSDRQTVAIEIHPHYRGKNLAFDLIEESGSTKPERDHNPEFWAKVAMAFN